MLDDNTQSLLDQLKDAAVLAERDRCLRLLEMMREEFRNTDLEHVWCRVRNQIANGDRPPSAGGEDKSQKG